jgi:hypothetical protein
MTEVARNTLTFVMGDIGMMGDVDDDFQAMALFTANAQEHRCDITIRRSSVIDGPSGLALSEMVIGIDGEDIA